MALALRFIPVEWRFVLLYAAGALLVLACGIYTGQQLHAPTITRTVQVVHAPANGVALVAAWGKADTEVDGAQINANLKGTTCAVYQSRRAVVCYVAP